MVNLLNSFGMILSGVNSALGSPKNNSFWSLVGDFFINVLPWIGNMLMKLVYIIMKFVLNIVDFFQYFVKKLVGLDYWGTSKVSVDTLGESDVIFRFIYNDSVQKVFKYLVGIFFVLLIVFTVFAIIRNEYAFATDESGKASNSKTAIFKRAGKAILLVFLLPVMIVFGILASNAILTSLVNAFNINNKLTMGGQIFVASSYDANKYRKYADGNIRIPATNNVNVWVDINSNNIVNDGEEKLISSSIPIFTPSDRDKESKFTGFLFTYGGKNYLYYVSQENLKDSAGNEYGNAKFYYKFLNDHLGATVQRPSTFGEGEGSGQDKAEYVFSGVSLHALSKGHVLNEACYNSWEFNEILTRENLSFDKTLHIEENATFRSDAGYEYNTRIYTNNDVWGNLFDGGENGFVAIKDEYYVMADIVDYMVNDVVELAFVNINNPQINWDYSGESGQYLNARYVDRAGVGNNGGVQKFVVNYKDAGYTQYVPNLNSNKEETGAIFIVAYYSANTNKYIPLVHGMAFTDDYGDEHVFESDHLDSSYQGLVVARGVLDSTFKSLVGVPTVMQTGFETAEGDYVDASTPYFQELKVNNSSNSKYYSYATKYKDFGVSFSTGSDLVNSDGGKYYLNLLNAGRYEAADGITDQITKSMPAQLGINSYKTAGGNIEETILNNINWTYTNNTITIDGESFHVLKADKSFRGYYYTNYEAGANVELSGSYGDNNIYALINLMDTTPVLGNDPIVSAKIYYVYTPGALSGSTNAQIHGDFLVDGSIKARFLTRTNNLSSPESKPIGVDNKYLPAVTAALSGYILYPNVKDTYDDTYGGLFDYDDITRTNISDVLRSGVYTPEGEEGISYSYSYTVSCFETKVKQFIPAITGDVLTENLSGDLTYNGGSWKVVNTSNVSGGSDTYLIYCNSSGTWQNFADAGHTPYFAYAKISYRKVDGKHYLAATSMPLVTLDIDKFNSDGTSKIKDGSATVVVSLYDMQFVETVDSEYQIYRYEVARDQYGYFKFKVKNKFQDMGVNNADCDYIDVTAIPTGNNGVEMLRLDLYSYSAFTYKVGDVLYEYDPIGKESNPLSGYLTYDRYYVRPSSIKFDAVGQRTNTVVIWQTFIYAEDNDYSVKSLGSNIFTGYFEFDKNITVQPTNLVLEPVNYQYFFEGGNAPTGGTPIKTEGVYKSTTKNGTLDQIPAYVNTTTAENFLGKASPTIKFYREKISKSETKFDFCFNLLNIFNEGPTWRFKLSLFNCVGSSEVETLKYKIVNGRLNLDYNFNSTPGLSIDTYYVPGFINPVILVFASVLVLMVLGQAVWGMIGRIYDITLYFVVMPAVVSTIAIQEKSTMYNNWQSNLIKKVLGAYGTMLGLNFFFILIPAIRDASRIFTQSDLNSALSTGNFLHGVSAGFLNNLIYILFLLVACTLIKTLPATISDIMSAGDVYGDGKTVKSNVDSITKEGGRHLSGKSILEAPGKLKEKLKDQKNFIPGSAIYDKFKEKAKAKKEDKKNKKGDSERADSSQETQDRGNELARQRADALMNQATSLSDGANELSTSGLESSVQNDANDSQEAIFNLNAQFAGGSNVGLSSTSGQPTDPVDPTSPTTGSGVNSVTPELNVDTNAVGEALANGLEPVNTTTDVGNVAKAIDGKDFGDLIPEGFENNAQYNAINEQIKELLIDGMTVEQSMRQHSLNASRRTRLGADIRRQESILKNAQNMGLSSEEIEDRKQKLAKAYEKYNEIPEDSKEKYQALRNAVNARSNFIRDNLRAEETAEQQSVNNEAPENAQTEVAPGVVDPNAAQTAEHVNTAQSADSVQTAQSAENAQNAANQAGTVSEQVKLYAQSAQKAAEAAQLYADIAGGRVNAEAEIALAGVDNTTDTKMTRDEKKLAKLKAQREERDIEQAMGDTHAFLKSRRNRRKAYDELNEGKGIENQIITKDSKAVQEEAVRRFKEDNKAAFRKGHLTDDDIDKKDVVEAYFKDIQTEAAVKKYNKKNGTSVTAEELANDKKLKDKVMQSFAQDQEILKMSARNDFINSKLDAKIAKQEHKMELKASGEYEGWLKKGLMAAPRALIHKTTDAEREKLISKKDKANARIEAKQNEIDEIKKNMANNRVNMNALRAKERAGKITNKEKEELSSYEAAYEESKNELKRVQEEAEKAIAKDQKKIAKLNGAIEGNYGGILAGAARTTANGARAVKSKWYDKRAEHMAKNEQEAEKKFKTRSSAVHSKDENGKVTNEKFTDSQLKTLDKKLQSKNAAENALDSFNRTSEFVDRKTGNTLFENRRRIWQNKANATKDLNEKAKYERLIANANAEEARYNRLKKDKEESAKIYKATKNEFNTQNLNSYTTNANKYNKAKYNAIKAAKRATLDKLNSERRKGILTDKQEAAYLKEIQGQEEAMKNIALSPTRFQKAKAGVAYGAAKFGQGATLVARYGVVVPAKAVGKAAKVTGKAIGTAAKATGHAAYVAGDTVAKYTGVRAIYRKAKRVKAAKAYMAQDSVVADTKDKSAQRQAAMLNARRLASASTKNASIAGKGAQLASSYMTEVQKVLSKAGRTGKVINAQEAANAVEEALRTKQSVKAQLDARIKEITKNGSASGKEIEKLAKLKAQRTETNAIIKALKNTQNHEYHKFQGGNVVVQNGNVVASGGTRVNARATSNVIAQTATAQQARVGSGRVTAGNATNILGGRGGRADKNDFDKWLKDAKTRAAIASGHSPKGKPPMSDANFRKLLRQEFMRRQKELEDKINRATSSKKESEEIKRLQEQLKKVQSQVKALKATADISAKTGKKALKATKENAKKLKGNKFSKLLDGAKIQGAKADPNPNGK